MVRNQQRRFGRWIGGAVLLMVVAALVWAPWSEPAAADANMITIQNFVFSPDNLIVPVGTTVTWKNLDGATHQIVSDTGAFPSSSFLGTNATYTFTFMQPGIYVYHCGIHATMLHKMITVIQPDVAPGRHPTVTSASGIGSTPLLHPTATMPMSGALAQPPRH